MNSPYSEYKNNACNSFFELHAFINNLLNVYSPMKLLDFLENKHY